MIELIWKGGFDRGRDANDEVHNLGIDWVRKRTWFLLFSLIFVSRTD